MRVHAAAFRTKEECREFFKDMLARYAPGETVSDADRPYLESLLADYHPEGGRKIGCGVRAFRVEQDPVWKRNRHFLLVRTDGSTEDFSYLKCIAGRGDEHRRDVLWAMRADVYDQIRQFRDAAYGAKKYVRCGITNLNVRRQDCHIDHAPPATFLTLVRDFLEENGLRVAEVAVTKVRSPTEATPLTLADPIIRAAWARYHREHAVLRVTLDHANLGQKRVAVNLK